MPKTLTAAQQDNLAWELHSKMRAKWHVENVINLDRGRATELTKFVDTVITKSTDSSYRTSRNEIVRRTIMSLLWTHQNYGGCNEGYGAVELNFCSHCWHRIPPLEL